MPAIFISYRRDDTLSAAGRLADALSLQFGSAEVFRDVEAIEAGADFRVALLDAVRAARVVLVIIGRQWATQPGVDGQPRLHAASDYVRLEIEQALAHGVPIVPVLVESARMPRPEELPESIRPLAYRHAQVLDDARWHRDAADLVELLARTTDLTPTSTRHTGRDPTPPLGRRLIRHITDVPFDAVRLLYEPRRLLVTRGSTESDGLLPAVVFLIVSQVLAGVLVLQVWPTRSNVVQFVITPAIQMLLLAVVLSIPLYLAWRLAGASRQYARVLVILLYQCGFLGLGVALATVVTMTGMALSMPAAVEELARNPGAEGLSRFLTSMQTTPNAAPWVVASMMTGVLLAALLLWLVATWTAYRDALHQPSSRSWIALALFTVFCAVPLWTLAWVAVVLQRAGM